MSANSTNAMYRFAMFYFVEVDRPVLKTVTDTCITGMGRCVCYIRRIWINWVYSTLKLKHFVFQKYFKGSFKAVMRVGAIGVYSSLSFCDAENETNSTVGML